MRGRRSRFPGKGFVCAARSWGERSPSQPPSMSPTAGAPRWLSLRKAHKKAAPTKRDGEGSLFVAGVGSCTWSERQSINELLRKVNCRRAYGTRLRSRLSTADLDRVPNSRLNRCINGDGLSGERIEDCHGKCLLCLTTHPNPSPSKSTKIVVSRGLMPRHRPNSKKGTGGTSAPAPEFQRRETLRSEDGPHGSAVARLRSNG
jgi:hypothetical protein